MTEALMERVRKLVEKLQLDLEKEEEKKGENETITLTFGDCGENHKGMQMIGKLADHGFSLGDLERVQKVFQEMGAKCQIVDLGIEETKMDPSLNAYLLVIEDGFEKLVEKVGGNLKELMSELRKIDWDKKAFMKGRVVNKLARHNVCFDEFSQEPDYLLKKGRVVKWEGLLKKVWEELEKIFASHLIGEGNRYYDLSKCGIGFHGDSERKKVIGARIGEKMELVYQWFYKSKKVGKEKRFLLPGGSLYVMSEKGVGCDWLKKNVYTLRHAAGTAKYVDKLLGEIEKREDKRKK